MTIVNYNFSVLSFVFSASAILLTPGPTNTILAVAGSRHGVQRALPMVVFELCGYVVAITAWGLFLNSVQLHRPWLGTVVRIASSCYLIYIAIKLWLSARALSTARREIIAPRDLFVATLSNPKGLLFASAIFPSQAFEDIHVYLAVMVLFGFLLLPIGFVWVRFGAVLSNGRLFDPLKLQKAAALVICIFSASIAWIAFR